MDTALESSRLTSFSFDDDSDDDPILTKQQFEDWSTPQTPDIKSVAKEEGSKSKHITRLFVEDDDDAEHECLARTPTEVAASIFRPHQEPEEEKVSDTQSLSSEASPPIGNLMESLWDYYKQTSSQNEGCNTETNTIGNSDDVFEPIPLQFWQASGAPVADSNQGDGDDIDSKEFCHVVVDQSDSLLAHSTSDLGSMEDTVKTTVPATSQSDDDGPQPLPKQQSRSQYQTGNATVQCISPDPSMRDTTCDNRKRKETDLGEEQGLRQQNKRIKVLPTVIGPDAPQMAPIRRFLEYLKGHDSTLETYATVQRIVSECSERHSTGSRKYKNLPGAIFEQAIKSIGGPEFQRLFDESQEKDEKETRHPMPLTDSRDASKIKSPSLVETAVGYGFHLARIHFLHDSGTNSTVHDLLQQGVDTVHRMSQVERVQFWKYMIETPLYQRQVISTETKC